MATSVRKLKINVDQTGNAEKGIKSIVASLGSLGPAGVVAGAAAGIALLSAGVVKLGVSLTKTAAEVAGDFQEQMNILEIAARASETSLDALSGAAIRVGGDTALVGINASQAADAMTNFYKAGLTTTEIFSDLDGYLAGTTELTGALRASIDLASASELDLATASDTVAIAMATFGMSAEEATHIADSFVASADASVASVPDLTEALQNVGPTAAAFGWSLDTVNVSLALLSERGIRGAEAGTSLKSMMTNLLRETDPVLESLDALNLSLYTEAGVMKALPTIMSELETSMVGLTEEEKNHHVQTLAGTYGMKAMQTLLAEGTVGWDKMTTSITTAATAQETASARTKGFNASIEQMKGTIETMLISAGTPLIEEFVTPVIHTFTNLATKVIPPLIEGFNKLMLDLKTQLMPVFESIGASLGSISDDMELAEIATIALDVGVWLLKDAIDGVVMVAKLAAIGFHLLAKAVKAIRNAIDVTITGFRLMRDGIRDTVNAMPDWLIPGSPTPFETGLRGVGKALGELDIGAVGRGGAGLAMAGAGGRGGAGVTWTGDFVYSPAVSLGDQAEAEEQIIPMLLEALRKAGGKI